MTSRPSDPSWQPPTAPPSNPAVYGPYPPSFVAFIELILPATKGNDQFDREYND